MKARGFVPAAIWHSGKLRGRQTAEAFLRLCGPFAGSRWSAAAIGGPGVWMRDELLAETRDAARGHMPHIADLARLMAPVRAFPLNGLIAFDGR